MPILNIVTQLSGTTGVLPSIAYISTSDTVDQVLTTGYLNQAVQSGLAAFTLPCMACVSTVASAGAQPDVGWYEVSYTTTAGAPVSAIWSLVSPEGVAPVVFADTTALAAPGTIRAVTGTMADTVSVMTSGNLVGVRGSVNVVGASGGFLYGSQGKVIASGTLSGSSWTAGVFGQLDISAATINAGQTAPVWADYGATSGTISDATGMRMFAGTNTTAATLNSMIYLYGKTSNLLELDANGSAYISTGGATASGTIKKIAILIEGVQYYLQAATVYS